MPKETIHTASPSHFAVEVGWQRDQGVQVATIRSDEAEVAEIRGWHADLDRDGINRLIRALRKARDQAFGSDA